MPFYLVTARPRKEELPELKRQLEAGAYLDLRPFGRTVSYSLENARWLDTETAVWEEEDYCTPPLKEERAAVLDEFFSDIRVEKLPEGEGWRRITALPPLFPELTDTRQ